MPSPIVYKAYFFCFGWVSRATYLGVVHRGLDEDLDRRRRRALLEVLGAGRDREQVAVGRERERAHRRGEHVLPDALLCHRVPQRAVAVAAARRKGAVGGTKGDRVDRKDDVLAVDLFAVALERVLLRLALGARVEELDRDAPLDRGRGVAHAVWHAAHVAQHVLERRLACVFRRNGVGRLGVDRVAELREVVHVHGAAGHGDDQARRRVLHSDGRRAAVERHAVHRKHLVGQRECVLQCGVRRRRRVPHLDRLIPRARKEELGVCIVQDAAHAIVVFAEDHRLAVGEVEAA